MQTFLPSPSYTESASILDQKRLGKQRLETLQIMTALVTGVGPPWIMKHWVTNMWRGYEYSLLWYQYAICYEWHILRGYEDTCLGKTADLFCSKPYLQDNKVPPFWLGDEDFHRSQRSNLLLKKPDWYGPMFEKDLPNDLPYVHPVDA